MIARARSVSLSGIDHHHRSEHVSKTTSMNSICQARCREVARKMIPERLRDIFREFVVAADRGARA